MIIQSEKVSGARELRGDDFEIIELPGHFFDMVGFRTPDDVVFLADCLSSRETLEKYQIGFIYDVAAYLNTLEKVKSLLLRLVTVVYSGATPISEKSISLESNHVSPE